MEFQISNEGANLYKFLSARGRTGQRFAPRFWETESSLGRERELLIMTCKKWHVAKRMLDQIRKLTNTPAIEYLFHEEATPLPDLGGYSARWRSGHAIAVRSRGCSLTITRQIV